MKFFFHFGRYLLFLKSMFSKPEKFRIFFKRVIDEMNSLGVHSLPIVMIVSLFLGAVTTVQTAYQLISGWIERSIIGSIVSDSTILELAPTLCGLVLAGKIGSNIASEIGTMRVSEQIDALEVMGISASNYLALPKIIAGLIMIPCLILIAMFLGIYGGMMVGSMSGILSKADFIQGARSTFRTFTLQFAMIKTVTFAFVITSVSCYQGFYTKGGAKDVGDSSTNAVVYSSVLILFMDYLLAELFL